MIPSPQKSPSSHPIATSIRFAKKTIKAPGAGEHQELHRSIDDTPLCRQIIYISAI